MGGQSQNIVQELVRCRRFALLTANDKDVVGVVDGSTSTIARKTQVTALRKSY
jgi:hypothetical protein